VIARSAQARRGDPEPPGALRSPGLLRRARNDGPGSASTKRQPALKHGPHPPQLREQLDFEHALEIADPAGAAGAALEADDALDGGDVIESPAAKIVLEIDQLLGKLVERPVSFRVFVDGPPRRDDPLRHFVRAREVALERGARHGDAIADEIAKGLVIEARPLKFAFEPRHDVGPVRMRPQHRAIAIADHEFDLPVLPRLETRRLAKLAAKMGVFARRHGPQDVPGVVELLENPRDAGQHLEGGLNVVAGDRLARRADLVNREPHPQFRHLMLDDEQHLVMRVRERLLRAENLVEMKIVAIAHATFKGRFGAFRGGVVRAPPAHVTASRRLYSGRSQARSARTRARTSTARRTSPSSI